MRDFTLLTDEEVAYFKEKYDVLLGAEHTEAAFTGELGELYKFYESKVYPYGRDKNSKLLMNVIAKGLEDPTIMENMVTDKFYEDGYELGMFQPGLLFYKSITWFFDSMPPVDRIWVGNLRIAAGYLPGYFVGLAVYKVIEAARVFIFSRANLDRLYVDCPPDVKFALEDAYGTGISTEEKIRRKRRKKVLVWQHFTCDDNAEPINFATSQVSTFSKSQHILMNYVEQRFGCGATMLPKHANVFKKCVDGEITIQPRFLEIDAANEFYWKNYGYENIEKVKDLALYKDFNNINFKAVRWLEHHADLNHEYSQILSVNVHMFMSVLDTIDRDKMMDIFIEYLANIKAKYVAIQEFPASCLTDFTKRCGYDHHYSVPNGYKLASLLVLLSNKPLNVRKIDAVYDQNRGSLLAKIEGCKVLVTHAPIGEYYVRNTRLAYPELFEHAYETNKKMRGEFLNDIIAYSPDIIMGDLNMTPADKYHIGILESSGYVTPASDEYTSFHDVKVDWVWHKPHISGKHVVYDWHYSDHRPIGFTIEKRGGGSGRNGHVSALLLLIAVTIVMMVYLVCHVAGIVREKDSSTGTVNNSLLVYTM
jgi:hypothetical protein